MAKRNKLNPRTHGVPFLARNVRTRWITLSIALLLLVWLIWAVLILCQSANVNVFRWVGFSEVGLPANEFGDAFGSLSALMTTLAAGGALFTLYLQGRGQSTQLFEDSFYNLLGQFRQTISESKLHQFGEELEEDGELHTVLLRTYECREVFEFALGDLTERMQSMPRPWSLEQIRLAYNTTYQDHFTNLSMYFRTSYHVFKTVKDVCPDDPYFYARIARAQLSNAELILLGYNCVFGEGSRFYIRYVREFRLMNNVSFNDEYGIHAQPLYFLLGMACFGR